MAERYHFGLENVLQLRTMLKDLEIAVLQQEARKRDEIRAALEECRRRVSELEVELESQQSVPHAKIDVRDLLMKRCYIQRLRVEIDEVSERLDNQDKNVARQQQVVLEKSRDQKVMEKLRERDRESYVHEERRKTDKVMDELVLLTKKSQ